MEIRLTKATKKDKEFLLQLRKATMTDHLENAGLILSEKEHEYRVDFHFNHGKIIKLAGEKVGLLKYVETEKSVEIIQIQILPAFQGKGIGTRILKDKVEKARSLGKEITLRVLKGNHAKFLYEKLGFQVVGEDDNEVHMSLVGY